MDFFFFYVRNENFFSGWSSFMSIFPGLSSLVNIFPWWSSFTTIFPRMIVVYEYFPWMIVVHEYFPRMIVVNVHMLRRWLLSMLCLPRWVLSMNVSPWWSLSYFKKLTLVQSRPVVRMTEEATDEWNTNLQMISERKKKNLIFNLDSDYISFVCHGSCGLEYVE